MKRFAGIAVLSALCLLIVSFAHADPLGGLIWVGAAAVMVVVYLAYTVVVWISEALVYRLSLKVRFRQGLVYSVITNLVSTIVGGVLRDILGQGGWKGEALGSMTFNLNLIVRSFLVALVVEGAVILVLTEKRHPWKAVLGSVVLANAVSYVITVPTIYFLVVR